MDLFLSSRGTWVLSDESPHRGQSGVGTIQRRENESVKSRRSCRLPAAPAAEAIRRKRTFPTHGQRRRGEEEDVFERMGGGNRERTKGTLIKWGEGGGGGKWDGQSRAEG